MLTFDVKRKINTLRDILVGKVPDPKAQVEQITIALIYKFMDDMDIEGLEFGGTRQFFTGEYEKYAWTEIMKPENSGQQRALLYAEGIEKMTTNPNLPQLFRDIFRGAYIPYRDPDTLNMFLKEVSDFSYDNSEDLGNAFEYLLSIMGSQGDAGQFRTPRHIIDMMVEIVDPKKNETILDPACGTAGFLISAYRHILAQNKDEDGKSTLTADDRKRLTENFAGYDISPDMVRLSRVNMYLHHFTKPKISEYDTLTSEEKWDDCYDVILANPPFMTPKGGIMPHSRYRVKAKRSEVLFVDYIAEHLNPNGRAAIIVPEGIVFQSANAYKELRKYLVDDGLLYAVISLPAGVFNPYSGVKTSILLIDKSFARVKDEILFLKLNNDGFDLGAQRREIKGSEIPEIIRIIKKYRADMDTQTADDEILHHPLVTIGSKNEIAKQDYILAGDRYQEEQPIFSTWPIVTLGEVCAVISGQSPEGKFYNDIAEGVPFYQGKTEFTEIYLGKPKKWTTMVTKISSKNDIVMSVRAPVGPVNIVTEDICIGRGLAAIRCSSKIQYKYLFYVLKQMEDEIQGDKGAAFSSINRKQIEQIKFPLPPISVQEKIVAELDGYQKIIDGARQVVDNYVPNVTIDKTWREISIGELYDISYGLTISIPQNEDNNGIKIISTAELCLDGSLDLSKIRKVKYEDKYTRFILPHNCLLFNWRNAPKHVGKTALFTKDDDEYISASFLLTLVNKAPNIIDNRYAWWAINDLRRKGYFMRNARQAVNQTNFNGELLAQTKFSVPSLDIQLDIISKLEEEMSIVKQNKRLIAIFEQKIADKIGEVWGE